MYDATGMTYPPLWLKGLLFELERDLLPIILRKLRIVSSGVKSSLRWLPVWESAMRSPTPFAVWSSTKLGQSPDFMKSKPTFSIFAKDSSPSPTYVEANYKALKSLLRERRKQIRNEDICTEQDYYNEEYNEEREMEPRPARAKETTLVLRTGSPRRRPSERRVEEIKNYRVNLPPLLAAHLGRNENGRPLQPTSTSVYGAHQPSNNSGGNLPPNDSTVCVTPFVCWIEDYPLPDGLKMPSHVGSYDGKWDPENYLHLFEGVIQRGDGVAGIKRRRRDLSSDGVWILATASQRSRLKVDLEPSTFVGDGVRHKATPPRQL
ncbi:hypothetical protein Tco_0470841 [Tanacetum coccineum]